MTRAALQPGATLGVFGAGQLGRMFAMAASRLGYSVCVFAPDQDAPAVEVSGRFIQANYTDSEAVRRFAEQVDAVTYEFENVPAEALQWIGSIPALPQPGILHKCRHRIREKTFLRDRGIPVTPFEPVRSAAELEAAAHRLGGRVVVKTVELGYDGKGQVRFESNDSAETCWTQLGQPREAIAEQWIALEKEVSILVARDAFGATVFHGPYENTHRNHILDTTVWRAKDNSPTAIELRQLASAVADAFELQGMICVECFQTRDGSLMMNEIAPRPHNSGHLSIEAESISQFEQQVRLLAGWPAVSPTPRAPAAAMVNLLGDLWDNGEPNWQSVLSDSRLHLHLYGKREARAGRKMGHITALGSTPSEALDLVLAARTGLQSMRDLRFDVLF